MELLHDQTFWVAFAFAIFVVLTLKKITSVIVQQLNQYAKKIDAQIDDSEKIKNEAQNLLAQQKKKRKELDKQISSMIEESENKIHEVCTQTENDMQDMCKRKIEESNMRMKSEYANFMNNVRQDAVNILVNLVLGDPKFKKEKMDTKELDKIKKQIADATI